jgi:hypothetical protein
VDHIVRSGAFRSRNVDALFFMLGCFGVDPVKSAMKYITSNLHFYIRCDLWVM